MTALARAFLAVVPSPAALDAVEAAAGPLRLPAGVRRSPRDQWHVTLRFLGRVHDVTDVAGRVRAALGRSRAFEVRLGGGGAFPSPARAGVLWVGAAAGGDGLVALAGALGAGGGGEPDPLAGLVGQAPEERVFHPHLTLARARTPTDLRDAVAALDAAGPGPAWTAAEVVLFESRTAAAGATHTVRERLVLGDPGPPAHGPTTRPG